MNRSTYTWFMNVVFGITFVFLSNGTLAAILDEAQQVGEKKLVEAEKSQKKIDKIVEGAQERLIQYRSLLKQVEGL